MSLLKNSTIVIAGVIVSNLLAYVFHFFAGRMLGPEDYGEFGALMALYLIVALPVASLAYAISKFTAKFNTGNELGKIALLRKKMQKDVLIFSGVTLFFVILFSRIIANFLNITSAISIIIVGITLLFALLLPVNNGILLGMKKFRVLSMNAIIEAFARLVLLLIFLYLGYSVNGAILAYGLAYLVAFLWTFPYLKEVRVTGISVDKIEVKPIYKFIFQVLLVNIIIQSILNVPSLFVKHFYTSEFTGYWTAALNIARISLFISGAISFVMFPEIAGEEVVQAKKKIFKRAALLVLIASSGMAAIFFTIPQLLIEILYGSQYLGAVKILEWMGIAMIFIGLLQLYANYFLAKLK
jgi:O-antigen/teichoic acid export membrane protein